MLKTLVEYGSVTLLEEAIQHGFEDNKEGYATKCKYVRFSGNRGCILLNELRIKLEGDLYPRQFENCELRIRHFLRACG